ncbi:MAG TPA: ribosome small subunit-dependent GTPase A, partial [Acidimicrobiales bacterium]|nr:ribosome small subunit-dependent GTPase A [Acidimicrobiales bacterium]
MRVERTRSIAIGSDGAERVVATPSTPVVGDWVVLRGESVEVILPRTSVLARMDPDGSTVQTLASNIDLVLITVPADRPSAARVERELAVAYGSGAQPIVVISKGDLGSRALHRELRDRLIGVEVRFSSARNGEGVAEIAELLRPNRTAVLLGPSGAGKSTLANALLGSDRLATGEVRDVDARGRHTTTTRQLVLLPGGGVIIDTPGLRGLGLVSGAIGPVFPEIVELVAHCRFDDCTHRREPGCAVVAAISSGRLSRDRLKSYRKLSDQAVPQNRSQAKSPPKSRKGAT